MSNTPKWYIFDLDGTLYDFWGASFSGSKLGIEVKRQYFLKIEQHQLGDPDHTYREMIDTELETGVWISQQLADKLWTTRWNILQIIWWEISPNDIIENIVSTQKIIPILKEEGKSLFLVTAAPRVWAVKALEFIAIKHYFDEILTLEDYWHNKQEAFVKIRTKTGIASKDLISIGDQIHSDIIPARALWMQSLLVSWPQDLHKLIS